MLHHAAPRLGAGGEMAASGTVGQLLSDLGVRPFIQGCLVAVTYVRLNFPLELIQSTDGNNLERRKRGVGRVKFLVSSTQIIARGSPLFHVCYVESTKFSFSLCGLFLVLFLMFICF